MPAPFSYLLRLSMSCNTCMPVLPNSSSWSRHGAVARAKPSERNFRFSMEMASRREWRAWLDDFVSCNCLVYSCTYRWSPWYLFSTDALDIPSLYAFSERCAIIFKILLSLDVTAAFLSFITDIRDYTIVPSAGMTFRVMSGTEICWFVNEATEVSKKHYRQAGNRGDGSHDALPKFLTEPKTAGSTPPALWEEEQVYAKIMASDRQILETEDLHKPPKRTQPSCAWLVSS